jgi:HAD superfamily hydrolase (TIGR01509 family)
VTASILDLDGTLVDTNYHHTIAWYRALRQHEIVIPMWRIHRHIGMGDDRIVAALAGQDVERSHGNEIRVDETSQFQALINEIEPLEGAHDFVRELKERGLTVVLASSAKQHELDYYLDLLDVRRLADGWTSSADVDATKPAPDLVQVALERAGGGPAVMVGDTVWDVKSARQAGVETICVLTGGFRRTSSSKQGPRWSSSRCRTSVCDSTRRRSGAPQLLSRPRAWSSSSLMPRLRCRRAPRSDPLRHFRAVFDLGGAGRPLELGFSSVRSGTDCPRKPYLSVVSSRHLPLHELRLRASDSVDVTPVWQQPVAHRDRWRQRPRSRTPTTRRMADEARQEICALAASGTIVFNGGVKRPDQIGTTKTARPNDPGLSAPPSRGQQVCRRVHGERTRPTLDSIERSGACSPWQEPGMD